MCEGKWTVGQIIEGSCSGASYRRMNKKGMLKG